MPTAIGANTITSISKQYVMPTIVDNIYNSNAFFFRINKAKRFIKGGTQIEVPLMYARFNAGGAYSGYDQLTITPQDTVKSAVWPWRQHYVAVALDGLTMIKNDSPDSIANLIKLQFAQAEMEMAENLAAGIFSTGAVAKEIDGLQLAIDSAGTYAGIDRATNTWWGSQEDGATTALSMTALNSLFSSVSEGGRHPTIIMSAQANYDRYWQMNQPDQQFHLAVNVPYDEMLAQAGFTNQLFNGVPWLKDSHVHNDNTIYMIDEEYVYWAISPRADFYLEDFQKPVDQDAYVSTMFWAGNLLLTNCARQGKMTAITSVA